MRDFLQNNIGLKPYEATIVIGTHAVWRSMDLQCPLWKTAGVDIYDRFESRVRAAARELDVTSYVNRLARKCHVAVPNVGEAFFADARGMSVEDNKAAMDFARDQSGLLVAAMRAYKDDQKAQREEKKAKQQKLELEGDA